MTDQEARDHHAPEWRWKFLAVQPCFSPGGEWTGVDLDDHQGALLGFPSQLWAAMRGRGAGVLSALAGWPVVAAADPSPPSDPGRSPQPGPPPTSNP